MTHTDEQTRAIAQAVDSLTNHTPSPEAIEVIERVRERAIDFAIALIGAQRPSRERSLAVTKLEESVMWAVKGIVLAGLESEDGF